MLSVGGDVDGREVAGALVVEERVELDGGAGAADGEDVVLEDEVVVGVEVVDADGGAGAIAGEGEGIGAGGGGVDADDDEPAVVARGADVGEPGLGGDRGIGAAGGAEGEVLSRGEGEV